MSALPGTVYLRDRISGLWSMWVLGMRLATRRKGCCRLMLMKTGSWGLRFRPILALYQGRNHTGIMMNGP